VSGPCLEQLDRSLTALQQPSTAAMLLAHRPACQGEGAVQRPVEHNIARPTYPWHDDRATRRTQPTSLQPRTPAHPNPNPAHIRKSTCSMRVCHALRWPPSSCSQWLAPAATLAAGLRAFCRVSLSSAVLTPAARARATHCMRRAGRTVHCRYTVPPGSLCRYLDTAHSRQRHVLQAASAPHIKQGPRCLCRQADMRARSSHSPLCMQGAQAA